MLPRSTVISHPPRKSRAFSLVEVTISVSIMTFAAISMAGLMPSNLARLSGNIEKGRAQSISQSVLLEASRTSFPELIQRGTFDRYFNNEGELLAAVSDSVNYVARVRVNRDAGGGQKQVTVPGSQTPPSSMATVNVEIFKAPGGTIPGNARAVAAYSGLVACKDLSVLQH